jgi:mono/diheme cytochrome c family protein
MKLGASRWIALAGVAGWLALAATLVVRPALAAPAASPATGPAAAPAAGGAAPAAAAAPGQAVFQDVCGNCHDLALSTGLKKSRDDWQATVSRMVSNGAPLSDAQVALVVDYLAKAYGTN